MVTNTCYLTDTGDAATKIPLEKQTLAEFYEATQGYYPTRLPKYPSLRQRSAPAGRLAPVAPASRPPSQPPAAHSPRQALKSRSLVMTSADAMSYKDVVRAASSSDTAPLRLHM